jgi:hypothetical protein
VVWISALFGPFAVKNVKSLGHSRLRRRLGNEIGKAWFKQLKNTVRR